MAKDDRDVLEVLKAELDFIEKGGYGRSVRTPWKRTSIFQDSLTCLNFGDPARTHPCSECLLMEFVPPEARSSDVPCHQIPLSREGGTVESLFQEDDAEDVEDAVKAWLRTTIARIENSRAQLAAGRVPLPGKSVDDRGERKRLLIVDDDEGVLIKLEQRLENAGYSTTTAWSGQEALRLLRLGAYDLVLLDDFLRDIPSEEVLRQLRSMTDAPPVLVMQSGTADEYFPSRSTRLDASRHVAKHDVEQVVQGVERYFSARPKVEVKP